MKSVMIRTDFSVGESALKATSAIELARERGYSAVISADTMSISSVIPLTLAAGDMAVVCGTRLTIVDDPTYEHRARLAKESGVDLESITRKRSWSLIALICNDAGFRDLCELLTMGFAREQFYYEARVSLEQVADVYARGNILLLTPDVGSPTQRDDCTRILSVLTAAGGTDKLYAAVYPIATPLYDQINSQVLKYADALGLPKVAFYPAYYDEGDAALKDVAYLVANNIKADQPWRARVPYQRDNSLQDRKHLLTRLAEFSRRMGVSVSPAMVTDAQDAIITACTWRWKKMPIALPHMADDEPARLRELATAGLKEKLLSTSFGYKPDREQWRTYITRLNYELGVLSRLGFCGYFLMVCDLMNWAREAQIPVGPGRGSSAGSLVAWCVNITNVDPIRHGLIFERFINPERLDLPDADLDFSQARRQEVIEYLSGKYGSDYVAGIPNYTYLGAASAMRDAGRIYGVTAEDLAATKDVSFATKNGGEMLLEELREELASVNRFAEKYPEAWSAACKLQSLMRGYGRHAAGVIVSGVPLTERAAVELRGGERVINWDKRFCEDMGLVKLDVLGLATLDLLALAKRYIVESGHPGIDLESIPLDDPAVLENFAAGRTKGVFQLESSSMRHTLKELGAGIDPMTFDTVVATTALFRPGPIQSGMLDNYIAVAKGYQEPESLHPMMTPLTRETNGVILYQEQTMLTVRVLAGFTMAEADGVRKAIGKKDAEKMHKMGELFIRQAQLGWVKVLLANGTTPVLHRAEHFHAGDKLLTVEEALAAGVELTIEDSTLVSLVEGEDVDGLTEEKARTVWEALEKNGAYQFNKSHAVAYTLISYQAMWLKTHFPAAFFAAALTILGEDKHPALVADAQEYGIMIMPPDINISSERIEIVGDKLYAPFSAIKGCSENGCRAIVNARAKIGGKFSTIEEFEAAVEKRACNARVRESLGRVGAFASIDPTQPPATDESRRKCQAELMGSLIIDAVKTSRVFTMNEKKNAEINLLMNQLADESGLGASLVRPQTGRKPAMMIILDGANGNDNKSGYFMQTGYEDFRSLLAGAGFRIGDLYITGLGKTVKDKALKGYSKEQMGLFTDYIRREIAIAQPTYILAAGSLAAGLFNNKMKASDLVGNKEYFADLDATVFYAFTPGILYFRPEEGARLQAIINEMAEVIFNK